MYILAANSFICQTLNNYKIFVSLMRQPIRKNEINYAV